MSQEMNERQYTTSFSNVFRKFRQIFLTNLENKKLYIQKHEKLFLTRHSTCRLAKTVFTQPVKEDMTLATKVSLSPFVISLHRVKFLCL